MDRDPSRDCEHGHLRRKCLICDLQEELAAEQEHAADAEAESVKLLERLAAERERAEKAEHEMRQQQLALSVEREMKETAYREAEAQVRKAQRAEAEAAAMREAGQELLEYAEGLNESCERYIRDAHAWRDRAVAAEAACARIQEALHLVVGGPMPVTPDSLRELADFMEKQRDE